MKRFFAILLSAAMLISASLFVSCGDNGSQETGGGGDNYYTGGGNGGSSSGNVSGNQEFVTIPAVPKNVTTKATSSSSIEVSWDAVNGADNYVVYYRLSLGAGNDSFKRNGTEIAKTTANTSISIQGLEFKIYLFWVTAKNSAGESRDSDVEIDYPSSPSSSGTTTTTLSAPTGLTATAASSSSIKLSWNSVSGATKYFIFRSEYSSPSMESVVSTATSTSTTITGLKANTKYYFWVKAATSATTSDYSPYAYATTATLPRGTLKIINNSSYTIKNLMLYTADYSLSSLSGMESLSCTVYKGTTEIVSNVYPGYYVEIGGKTYGGDSIKIYKTVVIQSGTTTTLIITDSDIISN